MKENKLIAEFMEFELQTNPNERWFNQWFTKETLNKPYNSRVEILHFDTDWNWLMEVVEKIKQVGKEELKFSIDFELAILTTNKETIYNACVEFIKWYNEQNK